MYRPILPNTNPNPKPPPINQPKPPPKSNRKNNKHKKNKNQNKIWVPKIKRNWVELPEDVWFYILSKLKTFDIIQNVQKVCMLLRNICKQPLMFKSIDMSLPTRYNCEGYRGNLSKMTRYAVDLSDGCLDDIYLDFVNFKTLKYIADRSSKLKHLRLGREFGVSGECLIKAIKKIPILEELQIMCTFTSKTIEAIGTSCPLLKSFSLTTVGSRKYAPFSNEYAIAIAKSMPHLRRLQLIGNTMSNEGLNAIFDGCPLLEFLDLHACSYIDLSGALGKRCEKFNPSLRPHDSFKEYGRLAYEEAMAKGYMSEDSSFCDSGSDDGYIFGYDPDYGEFIEEYDDYAAYLGFDDEYAVQYDDFHGFGFSD